MRTSGKDTVARVRKSLRLLDQSLEKEPVVVIDGKGSHWMNELALGVISRKGIQEEDFLEWLKIGSSHLQHITYGDIRINMLKLPGKEVVIFLHQRQSRQKNDGFSLTRKERELLRHLVKGLSNKKIAAEMRISPGTVNTHLDNLYSKLGCSNRLAACFLALKNGLFLPHRDMPQGQKA